MTELPPATFSLKAAAHLPSDLFLLDKMTACTVKPGVNMEFRSSEIGISHILLAPTNSKTFDQFYTMLLYTCNPLFFYLSCSLAKGRSPCFGSQRGKSQRRWA